MTALVQRFALIGALLLMVSIFGAHPRPTSAHTTAGALDVTSMFCATSAPNQFICNATVAGGTGGYAYKWTASNGAVIVRGSRTLSVQGTCLMNIRPTVSFTVTDSSGVQVTETRVFFCNVDEP